MVSWLLTNQAYLDRNLEGNFFIYKCRIAFFFKLNIVRIFYCTSSCDELYIFHHFVFSCFRIVPHFLLVSWNYLQIVWTQFSTNRTSVLIWIQTIWHSDSVPVRLFEKVNFDKKSADVNKSLKKYSACKQLITCRLIEIIHRSVFVT